MDEYHPFVQSASLRGSGSERHCLLARHAGGDGIVLTAAPLLLAAAAPVAGAPPPVAPPDPLLAAFPAPPLPDNPYWQVVIEERIIIRVPAQRSPLSNFSAGPVPPPRPRGTPIEWKEKKAPKCVAMRNIAGMQATQRDSIELITRQNQRLRAQLNRGCRALDFYAGFYMKGNEDGQLCEGRDEIHARTGARCEIEKFRLMVPVPRDED